MCSSNGEHRVRRWLIIEKNAAATADLQVDEARRKHRPGRHTLGWQVTRTLIARHDAMDHPTIDQDDRAIVPSISIENTVSRNYQLVSSLGSAGFGPMPYFLTGRTVDPIDPSAELQGFPARSPGTPA